VIFAPLEINGAFVIRQERRVDSRGFFARTWCAREIAAQGLEPHVAECTIWFREGAGAVREPCCQAEPYERVIILRCTGGALYCSLVDLRDDSASFRRHAGVTISAEGGEAVYIPRGVAQGFQTLGDRTEVLCQASAASVPKAARRISWHDPLVADSWPLPVSRPMSPWAEGRATSPRAARG
jgi:dTDP-4-dehydrorhamnose 3,5-epimerase